MKKALSGVLAAMLLLSLLTGCAQTTGNDFNSTLNSVIALASVSTQGSNTKSVNLTITGADVPQTQFARDEIMTAAQERGVEGAWVVSFDGIDANLSEQSYTVSVSDNIISIKGGDANGLMYGGLEVAEQIALYGAEGVENSAAAPYVLNRGFLLNVPLDMRSPAYNSPGDSGQNNIATMWEIEYWHEMIDDMARNRCNLLCIKNVNPYPSMVKVEGYEDIALNNVWRSTIPYDDSIKGDLTNIVREEDWVNYEVLKEMTIEDKIDFWREVMPYAKNRGIAFGIRHSNIYTYVEEGKYGITDKKENPITADYFYKACKTLLETYPDISLMSIGAGENMGWSNDNNKAADYQWVRDVYGTAINEVLANDPEREIVLDIETDVTMLEDIDAITVHTAHYSSTHLYAHAEPRLVDDLLARNLGLYSFTCRNEDIFNMRFGDSDFMRAFVKNMPDQDKLHSYITGSDGYCYGYEYSFADPELDGMLYTDKHWFNYFLMFRFLYDTELSEKRILDVFTHYYENEPQSDLLLEATSLAGKIIPMVNRSYYMSSGDYTWYAEANWKHPSVGGYIDIKNWMRGDTTYVNNQTMSIEEYAVALANGEEPNAMGRMLPTEVADNLKALAEGVLAKVERIRSANPKDTNLTFTQKEFWQLADDNEAMAYLGLFYAEKILGAINIRLFNETEDEKYKVTSISHLEKSAEYFAEHARIISSNYEPQRLSRVGYVDVNAILEEVRADIEIARTWKPRVIRPSFRTPDKYTHFASNTPSEQQGADGEQEHSAPPANQPSGEDAAVDVSRFAGEYDLYSEEKDMYCQEFVIEEDGSIHGAVEGSGLTTFEGTVSADGTITGEIPRLGGTMSGTITDDLQVSVHFSVRGSESDYVGGPY